VSNFEFVANIISMKIFATKSIKVAEDCIQVLADLSVCTEFFLSHMRIRRVL